MTKTKTKTKRVRIAVAVDDLGNWAVVPLFDEDSIGDARTRLNEWEMDDHLGDGYRVTVVEADAKMPEEPAVVQGEVVDG